MGGFNILSQLLQGQNLAADRNQRAREFEEIMKQRDTQFAEAKKQQEEMFSKQHRLNVEQLASANIARQAAIDEQLKQSKLQVSQAVSDGYLVPIQPDDNVPEGSEVFEVGGNRYRSVTPTERSDFNINQAVKAQEVARSAAKAAFQKDIMPVLQSMAPSAPQALYDSLSNIDPTSPFVTPLVSMLLQNYGETNNPIEVLDRQIGEMFGKALKSAQEGSLSPADITNLNNNMKRLSGIRTSLMLANMSPVERQQYNTALAQQGAYAAQSALATQELMNLRTQSLENSAFRKVATTVFTMFGQMDPSEIPTDFPGMMKMFADGAQNAGLTPEESQVWGATASMHVANIVDKLQTGGMNFMEAMMLSMLQPPTVPQQPSESTRKATQRTTAEPTVEPIGEPESSNEPPRSEVRAPKVSTPVQNTPSRATPVLLTPDAESSGIQTAADALFGNPIANPSIEKTKEAINKLLERRR